ncbi:MAG: DUF1152 domain-containing protein [Chloroflexi bacterium]|nr:DUF1152 domain-containing protein [Chloroflexota bacterium]
MNLNLPILSELTKCKSILIAGMGGGFDVFSGLPIYFELEKRGLDVHLANLSFSDIAGLNEGEQLTDTLVGVSADLEIFTDYFPEYYLSQWFLEERNEYITIWCFEKTGARPLIKNYRALIEHLGVDAVLLVDGGIDSLMCGDEPEPGTILEDTLSILAVDELRMLKFRGLACLGMGIEAEVGYAHLFENIAKLSKDKAFKGVCSLTASMPCYRSYEQATLYTFDQQPEHPSVIGSSVISAVRGEYGNYHLTKRTIGNTLNISPLMPIYWFFDLKAVARHNILIPQLRLTFTIDEAWRVMQKIRAGLDFRHTPPYPLP